MIFVGAQRLVGLGWAEHAVKQHVNNGVPRVGGLLVLLGQGDQPLYRGRPNQASWAAITWMKRNLPAGA